jgi:hypothetical protein
MIFGFTNKYYHCYNYIIYLYTKVVIPKLLDEYTIFFYDFYTIYTKLSC